METHTPENEHKVLVGFKCSPALRLTLCGQAGKMGVSLSSHVETLVLSHTNKDTEIKQLSAQIKSLQEKLAFYETPFLRELYSKFNGQTINFYDREDNEITLTINDIQDVYSIIINSFKIDK